uniref:Pilus assembly protein n=1 Tax=Acidicaldus sp. TaxID=1872105 RepID=A0A8J4M7G8_9PROT
MAADGDRATLVSQEGASGRSDRLPLLAFVTDGESESVLRESLIQIFPQGIAIRRAHIRAATTALARMPTPQSLIVDVSGEEQPLTALSAMSEVVEPDARVLVIGDKDDVNFYRQVTRGLGALEYLYKPLTRDMVARHFGAQLDPRSSVYEKMQGGRVVTVTGTRGGVGATTIAVHLAWHFGVAARRHTLLLDSDLHTGSAALQLDARTTSSLRTALETPERIDDLFVERAGQPVDERLHILASEEPLGAPVKQASGATELLLEALRLRYNFVVADVAPRPLPFNRELLDAAHQRVLVTPPTLAGAREMLRLLALPNGPLQPRRPVVVLNRAGQPGGLTRAQIEEVLGMKIDVVIPDLPRQVGTAISLGEPNRAFRGEFRRGMIELAREVAFVRLLESSLAANGSLAGLLGDKRRRRGLFGFWK